MRRSYTTPKAKGNPRAQDDEAGEMIEEDAASQHTCGPNDGHMRTPSYPRHRFGAVAPKRSDRPCVDAPTPVVWQPSQSM